MECINAAAKYGIMRTDEKEEMTMPYAVVEDKISEISPQYRGELLAFNDFLLYRQKNHVPANDTALNEELSV